MNFFSQPLKDQPTVPNEGDRQAAYIAPPADVDFTDVGYVIRAEMPGVEKDTLEITVERRANHSGSSEADRSYR